MAGPPLFPFPGLIVALMLGVTLAKLVVDESGDAQSIHLFYKVMGGSPHWFKGLNLTILGLGVLGNLQSLMGILRSPDPFGLKAIQLFLVLTFSASIGFAFLVGIPAERAVASSAPELLTTDQLTKLHHSHLVSAALSGLLLLGWYLLKRATSTPADTGKKTN